MLGWPIFSSTWFGLRPNQVVQKKQGFLFYPVFCCVIDKMYKNYNVCKKNGSIWPIIAVGTPIAKVRRLKGVPTSCYVGMSYSISLNPMLLKNIAHVGSFHFHFHFHFRIWSYPLQGGVATGKSTVSNMLRELGIPVIDADAMARRIVEPGRKAWKAIRFVSPFLARI